MSKPRNTVKGHNKEREYAQIFRDLGYSFCKTSRNSSRLLDNAGVDLAFIPFNVQIKAGYPYLNETSTLLYTKKKIEELFPPSSETAKSPCILIHSLNVGRGKKRQAEHEIVYMFLDDFHKTFDITKNRKGEELLPKDFIVKYSKRGWKYDEILKDNRFIIFHRYKTVEELKIIVFTFETLSELIKLNKEKWPL